MKAILKCAALTLVFCVTAAQAQQAPDAKPQPAAEDSSGDTGDRRGPPKMFGEKMKKELGLSDEQFKKLEENRVLHMKQVGNLKKELRALRKAFGEEMGKSGDTAKLKKIHSQIKELSAKMADAMLDGMLEVRKVLTPEQLAKFHERIGKMHEGFARHGMKGPDGEEGMPMKGRQGMRPPKDGCDCPCFNTDRQGPSGDSSRQGRRGGPRRGPPPEDE